jgi:hypothetical protein
VQSCAYLLIGGGLLGYLFSATVPLNPFIGGVSAASVRCGGTTARGLACQRLVKIGKSCPYHGMARR